jgi:hypothetical protein
MSGAAVAAPGKSVSGFQGEQQKPEQGVVVLPFLRPLKPETRRLLELLEELTRRARNIDSARHAPLTVLHALDDSRRFAALRTIRALAGIHHLLAICRFCNLCSYRHGLSPDLVAQRSRAQFSRDNCGWDATENLTLTGRPRKSTGKTLLPL